MLGLALALVAVGVVFLFILPWVGIVVGAIGLLLALHYFAAAARRPAERP